MPTVEIRADIGNITNILNEGASALFPHTFIQIVGSDGTVTTVGFRPLNEGSALSPGQVADDSNHPFDATSGQIQITGQRGQLRISI